MSDRSFRKLVMTIVAALIVAGGRGAARRVFARLSVHMLHGIWNGAYALWRVVIFEKMHLS